MCTWLAEGTMNVLVGYAARFTGTGKGEKAGFREMCRSDVVPWLSYASVKDRQGSSVQGHNWNG